MNNNTDTNDDTIAKNVTNDTKNAMYVVKRDKRKELLSHEKVLHRLESLCNDMSLGVLEKIDYNLIVEKVKKTMFDGVTTSELDEQAARISENTLINSEYKQLATRIIISNLHKNTETSFEKVTEMLYANGILREEYFQVYQKHKHTIETKIIHDRDYLFEYFGFKTLEKSYLLRVNNVVVERPQHMYMRIALAIHLKDLSRVFDTYNLLSQHFYTHASPTIFNAGTISQAFSSCFLLSMEDSMKGIYKAFSDTALISKTGGGIGINVSGIRAKGSRIRGVNGFSNGIIPMLKVYDQISAHADQAMKRKGSFAVYLEPYHPEILAFLDLKKNQGLESERARNLFYAVWTPDYFMRQVEKDGDWWLMCPDECKGLQDAYGEDFDKLYESYIEKGMFREKIKARVIWEKIADSLIESGLPYIGFKDAVNKKCNQKNLGTIKNSNLCVAPETKILTSTGYHEIKDLQDKEVNIWNGVEFSKTIIRKTGENQELLKISLSNGSKLECTKYHNFYIATGARPNQCPVIKKIEAQNLSIGMRLIKSDFPIITTGKSDFPYPYTHGIYCADGTDSGHLDGGEHRCPNKPKDVKYCNIHSKMYEQELGHEEYCEAIIRKYPKITLYGEKKKLVEFIETREIPNDEDSLERINCSLPLELLPKYIVPINYNLDIKLRWFEGVCDGDGCVIKSDNLTGIQIVSTHYEFLQDMKYMLQTMGCDPKISFNSEDGMKILPDGNGGSKEYFCNETNRLLLTSHDTATLCELGFSPKRLVLSGIYPKNNTKRWIQVEDIKETGRISDTYCFTEENRGMGIFNGIITGQCQEIAIYSDKDNYGVCNLATIALPKFVFYKDSKPYFNFNLLHKVAKKVVVSMNKVLDNNDYPLPETKKTDNENRPIGVGIQGLVDVYVKMRLPFESKEAKDLNILIFETLYHGLLEQSMQLSKELGTKTNQLAGAYKSFNGSPFSQGKLQFDLAKEFDGIDLSKYLSDRYDWDNLKSNIQQFGIRNSLLGCLPPTASTAQVMGNSESFEVMRSCFYTRNVLSGDFVVINKYLLKDLEDLGIWSEELKDKITLENGSIQAIPEIPQELKNIYKTAWEVSMKTVIDQCADRGVFIDQMQSMNLYMANPSYSKISSMLFYSWKANLKSGIYYLRSKAQVSSAKFTVDPELEKKSREEQELAQALAQAKLQCSIDNKDECMMCSS
ncbi:MAG: ribonucleotide reductase N-terminal alpha domain-containing protein [Candidatus Shapirobacteria bacterium]|nr:ribonucleotide reductase N-terminal alpha domain-containing protein [Candidatus Shapirobacteria bacterium]